MGLSWLEASEGKVEVWWGRCGRRGRQEGLGAPDEAGQMWWLAGVPGAVSTFLQDEVAGANRPPHRHRARPWEWMETHDMQGECELSLGVVPGRPERQLMMSKEDAA